MITSTTFNYSLFHTHFSASVYATEDGVHVLDSTEKEGDHVLGVHVLGPTEKEGDHSIPQVAYKWELFSWIGMNMHACNLLCHSGGCMHANIRRCAEEEMHLSN